MQQTNTRGSIAVSAGAFEVLLSTYIRRFWNGPNVNFTTVLCVLLYKNQGDVYKFVELKIPGDLINYQQIQQYDRREKPCVNIWRWMHIARALRRQNNTYIILPSTCAAERRLSYSLEDGLLTCRRPRVVRWQSGAAVPATQSRQLRAIRCSDESTADAAIRRASKSTVPGTYVRRVAYSRASPGDGGEGVGDEQSGT